MLIQNTKLLKSSQISKLQGQGRNSKLLTFFQSALNIHFSPIFKFSWYDSWTWVFNVNGNTRKVTKQNGGYLEHGDESKYRIEKTTRVGNQQLLITHLQRCYKQLKTKLVESKQLPNK